MLPGLWGPATEICEEAASALVAKLEKHLGRAPLEDLPAEAIRAGRRFRVRVVVEEIEPVATTKAAPIQPRPTKGAAFELKEIHRKLLEKATVEPAKARTLIARTPYKYNSNSRQALTDLVREGHLLRDTNDRYYLPAPPATAAEGA